MNAQQRYENLMTELDALCNELNDSDERQAEAAVALRFAAASVRDAMTALDLDDNLVYSSI